MRQRGRTLRRLGWALAALLAALVLTLAIPLPAWRTGEPPSTPLALHPGRPLGPAPLPVWIDTDAACGRGRRTDPDDCFAILLLARSPAVRIVGISTVFGNAPLAVTDSTTRTLAAVLAADGHQPPPIHRGASAPGDTATDAVRALRRAMADERLVVVALGPLTNVAAALGPAGDDAARPARLVAVMGRRRGHLFHPVEGGTAGSLLGHGPVFRDFNFAKDDGAAAAILRSRVPLTLVPYEAARDLVLDAPALDRMQASGGAPAWVARRARGWLDYWRHDIGRTGFYPFDLVAAAYAVEPSLLRCAEVSAWIGRDAGLFGFFGVTGLFVDPVPDAEAKVTGRVSYCAETDGGMGAWLRARGM